MDAGAHFAIWGTLQICGRSVTQTIVTVHDCIASYQPLPHVFEEIDYGAKEQVFDLLVRRVKIFPYDALPQLLCSGVHVLRPYAEQARFE
jgi:hypothetical protein